MTPAVDMMGSKLFEYTAGKAVVPRVFGFHCPGCGHDHCFKVGGPPDQNWGWNGSMNNPTFTPSLLVNRDMPQHRCHSYVTAGKIIFLADCWHGLRGKTMVLPDWDDHDWDMPTGSQKVESQPE